MKKPSAPTWFLIRFVVLIISVYVVIALHPVNDRVIVPFTRVLTLVTGSLLRVLGQGVLVAGTTISSPHFAIDVENGCNGIEAAALLISAILAFPATMRSRLSGLLLGLAGIQIVNVFRLAMLFWLGEHHRSLFDLFHVAVWQTVIVIVAVMFFLFWSSRLAQTSPAPTTHP